MKKIVILTTMLILLTGCNASNTSQEKKGVVATCELDLDFMKTSIKFTADSKEDLINSIVINTEISYDFFKKGNEDLSLDELKQLIKENTPEEEGMTIIFEDDVLVMVNTLDDEGLQEFFDEEVTFQNLVDIYEQEDAKCSVE
ncbi:MAG: hypothetical protein ACK5KQ_04780 [Anaerorhabdus sp.]